MKDGITSSHVLNYEKTVEPAVTRIVNMSHIISLIRSSVNRVSGTKNL